MDRVTATAPITPAHPTGERNKQRGKRGREDGKPGKPAPSPRAGERAATGGKGRLLDDYA